jgi:hypothetical protein
VKHLKKGISKILHYGKNQKKMNLFGNQSGVLEDPDGISNVQLWLMKYSKSSLSIFILEDVI